MIALPRAARFRRAEDGAAHVTNMCYLIIVILLAGLSLDGANGKREQTHLQAASDAAVLAAVAHLPDEAAARDAALETFYRNRPGDDVQVLRAADVVFGSFDRPSDTFAPDVAPLNAARVYPRLNADRGTDIGTHILRLVGVETFDIQAHSIAYRDATPTEIPPGGPQGCTTATFHTDERIDTGGGNDLRDGVCINGQKGVHTGGGDYYEPQVEMMAYPGHQVTINHFTSPTLTAEDIEAYAYRPTTLVHQAELLRADISAVWSDEYYRQRLDGERLCRHMTHRDFGLHDGARKKFDAFVARLPDFLWDGAGCITMHYRGQWWTIQQNQIRPHSFYFVHSGAQFAGDVDARHVHFHTETQIGVGGGGNLFFDDVAFTGKQAQLAGNITWGDPAKVCEDGHFRVLLLMTERLAMGGWGRPVSIHGVLGTAQRFEPGGAMSGHSIYFTANQSMQLGGNLRLRGGCAETLETNVIPLPDWYGAPQDGEGIDMAAASTRRSRLVR